RELYTVTNIIRTDKAYVFVELTEELKKETVDWFIQMIHSINNDTTYLKGKDCGNNSFFCKSLCSYSSQCKHVYFGNK
ncbi:MAG: hypothetical protein ACRCZ1_06775, partial [Cetobacterium sp.]